MNKIIIAILTIILGSSILTAKDVQVKPEKNAVITVWESQGAEGDFINFAAKEFNKKYTEHNIKIKYLPIESTKTIEKMQISSQSGKAADIFVFSEGLGKAVNSGIIMPNLVSADKIKKDDITAAVGAATYKDGKIYGFPMAIETIAMFYNKKLLSTPPKSFEELLKVGVPFTNRNENKYGFYCAISSFYTVYGFFAMEGVELFGKNGYEKNNIGLNTPSAIRAMEDILTLKPMMFNVPPGDKVSAPLVGLFQEGKVMAIISGTWDIPRIKSSNVDFGIIPLPTFKGKHLNTFLGVRQMGVNPQSKYKKTAQLFAAFCTSPEMLRERYKMTNQIPPIKSILNDTKIKNDSLAEAFIEQAEYSKPIPAIPEFNLVSAPMMSAIIDAWTGKATPKQALDTAVKTIKEQIEMQNN